MLKIKCVSFSNIDGKLILFVLYNLAYVFYMTGYLPRMINLILLSVFVLWNGVEVIYKNKGKIGSKLCFWNETKGIMFAVLLIAVVSIVIQIIHLNIDLSLFSYYLYLIIPITTAFVWINNTNESQRFIYFYVFFARFLLSFILNNFGKLSVNAISSITFGDSFSSKFETSDAHCFFLLMLVFLAYKKRTAAIFSGLLCMLCFKRLCFILTPILFFAFRFIPRKKPSEKLIKILTLVFIISPIIIYFISQNVQVISNSLGLDIDKFASGRFSLIQYAVDGMQGSYNGYGSISAYLEKHPYGEYIQITDVHCDVLRMLFETTIIGVSSFFIYFFKLAKKNYLVLIIVCYFSLEMVVSHFVDVLAVWLILYMFCAMLGIDETSNECLVIKHSNDYT